MALINATDAELRTIIFENRRVLVKFVDKNCSICEALSPKVIDISEQPEYRPVVFLRIDAGTNPVSARQVKFTKAPFFAGYVDGMLVECGVLTNEKAVRDMATRLLLA